MRCVEVAGVQGHLCLSGTHHALGLRVGPVPTQLDNFARAKLIVRTTLLHAQEARAVVPGAEAVELELLKDAVARMDNSVGVADQPTAVPNSSPIA